MKNENHRFLDVPAIEVRNLEQSYSRILSFLVKNKNIQLTENQLQSIRELKSHTGTVIYDLYTRIMSDPKNWNEIMLLNCREAGEDIPVQLLAPELNLNPRELSMNVPEDYNKTWINITHLLGRRTTRDRLEISNIPGLHELIVRAFLCQSFYSNETWLNPNLLTFIVESYTMAISTNISQAYNLDLNDIKLLQTYIAHIFSKLCSTDLIELEDFSYSPILNRCSFLGTIQDITGRIEDVSKNLSDKLSPYDNLLEMIKESPIVKLHRLDSITLYSLASRGLSIDNDRLIMLEYPPYWVYTLLTSVSGHKSVTISKMMKMTAMKREFENFMKGLLISNLSPRR